MVDLREPHKASLVGEQGLDFSDIVGQEELKQALLTVVADDGLDGLLVRGEKGTAKSTAVRALRDLLPRQTAVSDCPYGCHPSDPDRQCSDCRERESPPTTERRVPLVTLPLGATREGVVGTLSVADALAGDYEFDPGLLARAHRGILYVDEVNLLDDHLVDVLLDAAAGGVNRVERDGVSVVHPAAFTLVGTMNPEEGQLRPQLRDRFALQATVTGCADLDRRVAILDRTTGLTPADASNDAEGTDDTGTVPTSDEAVRTRIREARDRLDDVVLPEPFAREIAELCRDADLDGHRGDIATARAAATLAALDGRTKVIESDVKRAAGLALPHRLQSRPFEDATDPETLLDEHFDDDGSTDDSESPDADGAERGDDRSDGDEETEGLGDDTNPDGTEPDDAGTPPDGGEGESGDGDDDGDGDENSKGEPPGERSREGQKTDSADDPERSPGDGDAEEGDGPSRGGSGFAADGAEGGEPEDSDEETSDGPEQSDSGDEDDRAATPIVPGGARPGVGEGRAPNLETPEGDTSAADRSRTGTGGRARAGPDVDGRGPRVREEPTDASGGIDAAASVRAAGSRGASSVSTRDLRQSVRERAAATLVVFAVDASASMRPAMRAAKGTVVELLKDAYEQRDEVAFVAFAGDDAEVLLPPTDSVTLAARHLKELPTGDRTPLPAGLRTAGDVIERADPAASVVVVVTDGRANVADGSPVERTRAAARRLRAAGAHVLVVEAGDETPSLAGLIADEADGECVPLSALSADRVDAAAREADTSEI